MQADKILRANYDYCPQLKLLSPITNYLWHVVKYAATSMVIYYLLWGSRYCFPITPSVHYKVSLRCAECFSNREWVHNCETKEYNKRRTIKWIILALDIANNPNKHARSLNNFHTGLGCTRLILNEDSQVYGRISCKFDGVTVCIIYLCYAQLLTTWKIQNNHNFPFLHCRCQKGLCSRQSRLFIWESLLSNSINLWR